MSGIFASRASNKLRSLSVYKKITIVFLFLFFVMFFLFQAPGCKNADQKQTESLENNTVNESVEAVNDSIKNASKIDDTNVVQPGNKNPDNDVITSNSGDKTDAPTQQSQISTMATQATTQATTQTTTQATPTSVVTTVEEKPTTIKVTIPEGYSLVQICQRLESAGVNSFDKLFSSATTDNFSEYAAIREAGFPANRCFQLEGYLFPDTYVFYRDENPKSVWGRFLQNFSVKTKSYKDMLNHFGWKMDQAIIFASLLEREAGNQNEVAKVSSVMHNRLSSGVKLQLDASIVYVENYIKPFIKGDINRFNSYYNTYKTDALPAGPICNPGLRALNAALNPANTDYYYFANDNAEPPNYYYSRTLEEHETILEQYNIK